MSATTQQLPLDYAGHSARETPYRAQAYYHHLALTVIVSHAEYFRADFMAWLTNNWHVWHAFELEADRVHHLGCKRYSARTIGEYLRHQTTIREAPNEHGFKVNDHWWPDLGRLYMLLRPDRPGFFELRPGTSSKRAR